MQSGDFAGVKVFATPFFNACFGKLLADFPSEELSRLVKVYNLNPAGMDIVRRVIQKSKEYYANAKAREVVDALIKKESEK